MKYNNSACIIDEIILHPPTIRVAFPQVSLRSKVSVQEKINEFIRDLVDIMMYEQGEDDPALAQMVGTYEVSLNKRGLLSIYFENFAIRKKAANGMTISRALTVVDLDTGKVYQLNKLFIRNSPYRTRINNIIRAEIKMRDLPVIAEYPGISDKQEFYLTSHTLVVFFKALEFTPHVVGIPRFEIPYAALEDMIDSQGPLARMLRIKYC